MKSVVRGILSPSSLLLMACSGGGGGGGGEGGSSEPDFAKSAITSVGLGLADGSTEYVVTVILKNSNDTFVSAFTPTYIVTLPSSTSAASEVTAINCSPSDSNGRSYCKIKASTAGEKVFKVLNIGVSLQKSITFANVSASADNLQAVVSGGSAFTSQSGYKVSGSVGLALSGERAEVNGYKIYHSIQGQAGSTSQ